jgi:DNA-binding protein H-NS
MASFELRETGPEFRRTRAVENQHVQSRASSIRASSIIERQKLELHSMSVDDLFDLRDQITKILLDRVQTEQRELESRLARLREADGRKLGDVSPRRRPARPSLLKGRKIPAKYRNPENPTETWAGRGRLPKWLAAALEQGKQLADFDIVNATKVRRRNGKKSR